MSGGGRFEVDCEHDFASFEFVPVLFLEGSLVVVDLLIFAVLRDGHFILFVHESGIVKPIIHRVLDSQID